MQSFVLEFIGDPPDHRGGLSRVADGEGSIKEAISVNQSLSLARMPQFLPYRETSELEQALEAQGKVGLPS
jgi:hypothetical protein